MAHAEDLVKGSPAVADGQRAAGTAWSGTGGRLGNVWRASLIQAAALALALGLLAALWLLFHPLLLITAAIVLGEALSPLVQRLDRRLPRVAAILVVYLALFAILAGIGWLVLPALFGQALELFTRAPGLVDQLQGYINRRFPITVTDQRLDEIGRQISARGTDLLQSFPSYLFTATNIVLEMLLVVIMSIYWLIVAPSLRRFTLSLAPEDRRDFLADLLSDISRTMGGYVRGVVIDSAIIGVITYVALLVTGVQYPLALATLTGIGEVTPILGPIIAGVPAVAIALLQSPTKALIVLAIFVAIQQIESNIVTPYVMSKQTEMSPLLVLIALLIGGALGGILAALVAIPVAGAVRVLIVRVVAPAVRRWTGADPGAAAGAERPS